MTSAKPLQRCLCFPAVALVAIAVAVAGQAQEHETVLQFAPSQTTINFTLAAALHTVHGAFELKNGTIHFTSATNAIHGEILVDATTANTGNSSRDAKMHRDVLESARYREITFTPDRVEGKVEPLGKSTIQVHGTFSIHGAGHEVTIPVQVEMAANRWTATAHFVVPYVQWGMKNPSTFLLHVGETVDIDVHASGPIPAARP